MNQMLVNIAEICKKYGNDRHRMMDIVRAVQESCGQVTNEAMDAIAEETSAHRVEVHSVVSFYSFLTEKKNGSIVIRLSNDVPDMMKGATNVMIAFEKALGIKAGETTADGKITLEWTACVGMSDQAPAALVNDVFVTNLTEASAKDVATKLLGGATPASLTATMGDGNNSHELVKSMVSNNIKKEGKVIFSSHAENAGLDKALTMSPEEVIDTVKASNLRGCGGAGFPTGLKWAFTRGATGSNKAVLCNADEGEPGTFKDRVLLTEKSDLLLEGMTIAAYAIGAETGILYLRAEYAYLRNFLESKLKARRDAGLLGKDIKGKGFNFDIRIQMGAGAYICGEESSLISSCEGRRGDPKTRPPFPAEKGYLERPTSVNNVETFSLVTRIFAEGAEWFNAIGNEKSKGTKLISISGDCSNPGVFELDFGTKLSELLELAGAKDAAAVQFGGPSGHMVAPKDFDREICFSDLATGGSVMVFNKDRDILEIVENFMEFFVEESCGYCTPCRVGNVLLLERLQRIIAGKGELTDIKYLEDLCETIAPASRCGLGQTSPNPVASTIKNFRSVYEARVKVQKEGMNPAFDISKALAPAENISGRKSVIF